MAPSQGCLGGLDQFVAHMDPETGQKWIDYSQNTQVNDDLRHVIVDTVSPGKARTAIIAGIWDSSFVGRYDATALLGEGYVGGPREETAFSISPNPSIDAVAMSFYLERASDVRLEIVDVEGRVIVSYTPGVLGRGPHALEWREEGIAPGYYFCRLQVDDNIQTRVIVVR